MEKKRQRAKPSRPELAFDPVEAALRQMFDEVSAEPVPDDFAALISRLEQSRDVAAKDAAAKNTAGRN